MTAPPQIPLVPEPIVGWRVWYLGREPRGGSPLLLPAGVGRGFWPRRRAFEAKCHASGERPKGHRPPTKACSCGVYASDSLRSFLNAGTPPHASVIGQVSLWGKVIEHERGWRAKYAYPARLRLICAVCLQHGGGYAAPDSAYFRPPGLVVAACREHRREVRHRRSIDPEALQARILSLYAVDLLPEESLRPHFEFAGPQPTLFDLGWPEADVRPSSPADRPPIPSVPPVAAPPRAPAGGAGPASSAPTATVPPSSISAPAAPTTSWASGPTGSTASTYEPLAVRALKAVGVGIAWLLQAAFFVFMLFASCADMVHTVERYP